MAGAFSKRLIIVPFGESLFRFLRSHSLTFTGTPSRDSVCEAPE